MSFFFQLAALCKYFYLFTDTGYCSEDEDEEDECDEDMAIPWHDNTMFEMFQKWLESPCGKKNHHARPNNMPDRFGQ